MFLFVTKSGETPSDELNEITIQICFDCAVKTAHWTPWFPPGLSGGGNHYPLLPRFLFLYPQILPELVLLDRQTIFSPPNKPLSLLTPHFYKPSVNIWGHIAKALKRTGFCIYLPNGVLSFCIKFANVMGKLEHCLWPIRIVFFEPKQKQNAQSIIGRCFDKME